MKNIDPKNLVFIIAVLMIFYFLFNGNSTEKFNVVKIGRSGTVSVPKMITTLAPTTTTTLAPKMITLAPTTTTTLAPKMITLAPTTTTTLAPTTTTTMPPIGLSIQCSTNDPLNAPNIAVYKNMGNKQLRHYPNPTIADQWDPNWRNSFNRRIDCTGYTLGEAIPDKSQYTYSQNNGTVSGNTYCQGAWESTNGQNKNMNCIGGFDINTLNTVDCNTVMSQTGVPYDGLIYNCQTPSTTTPAPTTTTTTTTTTPIPTTTTTTTLPPQLVQDASYNCLDGSFHRYIKRLPSEVGKLYHYPNPAIATQWDSNWSSGIGINCSSVTKSGDLPSYPTTCDEAKAMYYIHSPDVKAAGMDAWTHYTVFGKNEGRPWYGPTCDITTTTTTTTPPPFCTAADGWSSKTALVGGTVTQACPGGGINTATCHANGDWTATGCPTTTTPIPTTTTPVPMPTYQLTIDGCEYGTAKTMSCPTGKVSAGSIKYGRWNNTVCPHSTVNASTPSKYSINSLPDTCIGQGSCTFPNFNNVVGDSYPNVAKQFTVGYNCDGTLANDLGAHNMGPWGLSFIDTSARWIWNTSTATRDAPANIPILFYINYFNPGENNVSATLNVAVDNYVEVFQNNNSIFNSKTGQQISAGGWGYFPVPIVLVPGLNKFAFNAINSDTGGSGPIIQNGGPAGLIFSCIDNNKNVLFRSDQTNTLVNSTSTYVQSVVTGQIKNKFGKCLDVRGNTSNNDTALDHYDCIDGNEGQTWQLNPNGTIQNKWGKCIDVPGNVNWNGPVIQQYDCNNNEGQAWTIDSKTGNLKNKWGKCAGVRQNLSANGTDLVQWDCNSVEQGQSWQFVPIIN